MATLSAISLCDTFYFSLAKAGIDWIPASTIRSNVALFQPALIWGIASIGIIATLLLNGAVGFSYLHRTSIQALAMLGCVSIAVSYRPWLIVYWMLLILGAVLIASSWIHRASSHHVHVNYRRKYFHALAVIMFLPGYLLEPLLMHLAFSVAFSALVFVELIRVLDFGTKLSGQLDRFMRQFLDSRDSGTVIISHLYLLVGCALPVWLNQTVSTIHPVFGLCGVLALGIGDTMASIVGKSIGRIKWRNRQKSVEGTLGFVVGLLCGMALVFVWKSEPRSRRGSLPVSSAFSWPVMVPAILAGLLEAFSEQNDNLVIPLYLYALLMLCSL
eukprot:jgi/Hompol1/6150/HPOL_002655-RA